MGELSWPFGTRRNPFGSRLLTASDNSLAEGPSPTCRTGTDRQAVVRATPLLYLPWCRGFPVRRRRHPVAALPRAQRRRRRPGGRHRAAGHRAGRPDRQARGRELPVAAGRAERPAAQAALAPARRRRHRTRHLLQPEPRLRPHGQASRRRCRTPSSRSRTPASTTTTASTSAARSARSSPTPRPGRSPRAGRPSPSSTSRTSSPRRPTPARSEEAATEDSVTRKLRELRYALGLEEEWSKKRILEGYLNIAYFGSQAYGIEVAAQRYFSIPAAELDAGQAATLAGIVKFPLALRPADQPEGERGAPQLRAPAHGRREHDHPATRDQVRQAAAEEDPQAERPHPRVPGLPRPVLLRLRRASRSSTTRPTGPARADRRKLLYGGGLTIRTTLEMDDQTSARRASRPTCRPETRAAGWQRSP